jgi:hypothetical protein
VKRATPYQTSRALDRTEEAKALRERYEVTQLENAKTPLSPHSVSLASAG